MLWIRPRSLVSSVWHFTLFAKLLLVAFHTPAVYASFSTFRDLVKGDMECVPPLIKGERRICVPGAEYDQHRELCCIPANEGGLSSLEESDEEDSDEDNSDEQANHHKLLEAEEL